MLRDGHLSLATAALCLVLIFLLPLGEPARAQDGDALAMMGRITDLAKSGKFDEAIQIAKRLLPIIEKMAGERHGWRHIGAALAENPANKTSASSTPIQSYVPDSSCEPSQCMIAFLSRTTPNLEKLCEHARGPGGAAGFDGREACWRL